MDSDLLARSFLKPVTSNYVLAPFIRNINNAYSPHHHKYSAAISEHRISGISFALIAEMEDLVTQNLIAAEVNQQAEGQASNEERKKGNGQASPRKDKPTTDNGHEGFNDPNPESNPTAVPKSDDTSPSSGSSEPSPTNTETNSHANAPPSASSTDSIQANGHTSVLQEAFQALNCFPKYLAKAFYKKDIVENESSENTWDGESHGQATENTQNGESNGIAAENIQNGKANDESAENTENGKTKGKAARNIESGERNGKVNENAQNETSECNTAENTDGASDSKAAKSVEIGEAKGNSAEKTQDEEGNDRDAETTDVGKYNGGSAASTENGGSNGKAAENPNDKTESATSSTDPDLRSSSDDPQSAERSKQPAVLPQVKPNFRKPKQPAVFPQLNPDFQDWPSWTDLENSLPTSTPQHTNIPNIPNQAQNPYQAQNNQPPPPTSTIEPRLSRSEREMKGAEVKAGEFRERYPDQPFSVDGVVDAVRNGVPMEEILRKGTEGRDR